MASVSVYNMDGNIVGDIDLKDDIFNIEVDPASMHTAVVQHLANRRQGTQSALTRAEVRGGGRKPWRQKGTGRARQGSIRSPQWRGGGVVFAPKPRSYSFKVNKKYKRLALKSALTTKVLESKLIVLDDLKLTEIKTKAIKKVLDNVKVNNALIVIAEHDNTVVLSARNIASVATASVGTMNVYELLKYDALVVTKQAVQKIEEVYA